ALMEYLPWGAVRGSTVPSSVTLLTFLCYVESGIPNGDYTPNSKIRQSPPIKLFFPKGGENSFSGGHLLS
ncbi:unnamed protein product, partial [marine sediment metagenome]